jgi:hypothetical protein
MIIVAFLSPVTNYVNNKKCSILEKYSGEEDQKLYASHWVSQTELYGGFVRRYLGYNTEGEGEGGDDF